MKKITPVAIGAVINNQDGYRTPKAKQERSSGGRTAFLAWRRIKKD